MVYIGPKFRSSETSDFGGMCFMTFSILHPDNEGHLWCLHYVFFLPIINKHLTSWKNAWVYHPLRTEKNKSLMQLWIRGLQEAWGSQPLDVCGWTRYKGMPNLKDEKQ